MSFGLFGNKLFACSMSGMVERLGYINDPSAYLNLCDDSISYTEKKELISFMQNREYMPACVVCKGNDDRIDPIRYTPGEQLA